MSDTETKKTRKCYNFGIMFMNSNGGTEAHTIRVMDFPVEQLASTCYDEGYAAIKEEFDGMIVRIQSMSPLE